ncbi:hypothetical protein CMT41_08755 [Colwellia sp. MT41]|uniref:STAS/SEC14 domain-containing protein n=1 Tax=unclassified Colwellia TaxID=196834 RepID=UPI00070B0FC5|nr:MULTISPECIES: STAS/SEC14 domain-containing protein [unclassified Colwellia]ALO34796.1 hypothetical protein CMT41_08755 [Colwellia sp. MT41]
MDIIQISFARICVLRDDLAEITVDSGVDINMTMVAEIHHCLLSLFSQSFSLLINKSHSYSSQLDALIKFGSLAAIDKIAVFAPNRMAKMSADFSATIPSSKTLNIEVFGNRDEALAWLT